MPKKDKAIGGIQGDKAVSEQPVKTTADFVKHSGTIRATIIEGSPTPKILKITKGTVPQAGKLKEESMGMKGDVVTPFYDPALLQEIVTESPILGVCIECMAVNVDGHGYTLEVIADPGTTEKKITKERKQIKNFLDYLNYDESLTSLRMKARRDMETMGWGAWEFVRNGKGDIAEVNHIPGKYLRITSQDTEYTEFKQPTINADGNVENVLRKKRFRRYVWVSNGQISVWYKEFGDPRNISCKDGKVFPDKTVVKEEEVATELYMFKLLDDGSVYPAPRWLGGLLSAVGARRAEELNFTYFDNNMFIPFVILVSGGVLSSDSMDRLKKQLEEGKGDKKPFRALVLEAMPMDVSAAVFDEGRASAIRVEIKPLVETVKDDMLFGGYDIQSRNKQRLVFRLPKILLGESEDYNRACYSDDTETLTEVGWKTVDEIIDGERIATYNPETKTIEFEVPIKKLVYAISEKLIHFTSKQVDILVTRDHDVWTRTTDRRRDRTWNKYHADSIPWDRFEFLTSPQVAFDGEGIQDITIEAEEKGSWKEDSFVIPEDKLMRLVGYLVSEGYVLDSKHEVHSHAYQVGLSQKDGEISEEIQEFLDSLPIKFGHSISGNIHRWWINHKGFWTWCRENIGVGAENKHLPIWFKDASSSQLWDLWESLNDGDGSRDYRIGRNSGYYSTISRQLADDVQFLATLLGMRTVLSQHYLASGNRKDCWRLNWSSYNICELRKERGNIEELEYTGRVYCFEVPNHLFVTRRNGKIAIQGNTAEAALSIVNAQVFDVERFEFDDFMNRKIFPLKGFIYHKFKSLQYRASDPQVMSEVLNTLSQTGVISPATARATASDILGRDIVLPDAEYIKYPFPLVQALVLMEVFGMAELQGDITIPEQFRGKALAELKAEIKKRVLDLLQPKPPKASIEEETSNTPNEKE